MTTLWRYVCESYCTVYLVPRMDLSTREAMAYGLQWPKQPDPLGYIVRRWLKPLGFLVGGDDTLPWFWDWRWPS